MTLFPGGGFRVKRRVKVKLMCSNMEDLKLNRCGQNTLFSQRRQGIFYVMTKRLRTKCLNPTKRLKYKCLISFHGYMFLDCPYDPFFRVGGNV